MSCKQNLLTVNTQTSNVPINGRIPLGSTRRNYGCAIRLNNNDIEIREPGDYEVTANITFNGTAVGDATISLLKNGRVSTGASITTSIATANTEFANVTIPTLIKVSCGQTPVTLNLVASGIATNINNVIVRVVKI